jgi:hypothetical protein
VARFCARLFDAGRRYEVLPTRANGQPAFGVYVRTPGGMYHGTGLHVLTVTGGQISAVTRFEASLLSRFGLPRSLPGR